jgi:hypothetical protein
VTVAVWSSAAEVEHRPKDDLFVMKEGAWNMANKYLTVLYNKGDAR